jgi:transcriptional regulator GlxA family with amidase domain
MSIQRRTVAILLFPDVELLDFAGPFEVLSSARALTGEHDRLFRVITVAETTDPITTRNGLVVVPATTLEHTPQIDILLVPGGAGTRAAMHNPNILNWVQERSRDAELTTSVCTGAFVLASAGLLAGRPATTYWESINELRSRFSDIDVRDNQRWIDAGDVITSAGVSAGIDMALHIVRRLYGADVARATALGIEYDYWE